MGTTAQTLYLSTAAKDFVAANEVDIRKLVVTAGASVSTTITAHGSAASTTSITLDPYSTSSIASDIRTNLGWALNRLGVDGAESTATALRTVPAGAWTFTLGVNVPMGATGTGALSVTYSVAVYRVSSAGARTLLFTAVSAAVASNSAGAGTGYPIATSAAQPEYVLLDSESIEVGYLSTCVQTAGLLGAVVAGNVTWSMGDAQAFVTVPAPGIRTRYPKALADTVPAVSDILQSRSMKSRALNDSTSTTEALIRQTACRRSIGDTLPVAEAVTRKLIYTRGVLDPISSATIVNNYVRPVLLFED